MTQRKLSINSFTESNPTEIKEKLEHPIVEEENKQARQKEGWGIVECRASKLYGSRVGGWYVVDKQRTAKQKKKRERARERKKERKKERKNRKYRERKEKRWWEFFQGITGIPEIHGC